MDKGMVTGHCVREDIRSWLWGRCKASYRVEGDLVTLSVPTSIMPYAGIHSVLHCIHNAS